MVNLKTMVPRPDGDLISIQDIPLFTGSEIVCTVENQRKFSVT
jgi:hypothetical protein